MIVVFRSRFGAVVTMGFSFTSSIYRQSVQVATARMTWFWPSLLGMAQVVEPATILRWHRAGFRSYWRWKSRKGQDDLGLIANCVI